MQRLTLVLCAFFGLVLTVAGCGPTYPKCNGDKDCREKEFCVNGSCQQCRDAKDCKAGQECKAGRCEAGKQGCSTDGDCPPDQSCLDGACRPCATDDQCGPGGKCQKGRCQRASSEGDAAPVVPAGTCKLEPVYFDFNESVLTTEATASIDRNLECLKKEAKRGVSLVGHTDPRGTEEYNLALSDKRAHSVKDRLTRVGVEGGRLKSVGKGELEATGGDESGWVKDRRVDLQW